jgi:hypothetical protein
MRLVAKPSATKPSAKKLVPVNLVPKTSAKKPSATKPVRRLATHNAAFVWFNLNFETSRQRGFDGMSGRFEVACAPASFA